MSDDKGKRTAENRRKSYSGKDCCEQQEPRVIYKVIYCDAEDCMHTETNMAFKLLLRSSTFSLITRHDQRPFRLYTTSCNNLC